MGWSGIDQRTFSRVKYRANLKSFMSFGSDWNWGWSARDEDRRIEIRFSFETNQIDWNLQAWSIHHREWLVSFHIRREFQQIYRVLREILQISNENNTPENLNVVIHIPNNVPLLLARELDIYKHNSKAEDMIDSSIEVLITWWTIWHRRTSFSGPIVQPIFNPVDENVFPALPIVNVRGHMFGNVAIRICFRSYVIHS